MNRGAFVWSARAARSVATLVEDAVGVSSTGSRAELEGTTAAHIEAVVVLLLLCARSVHVLQAGIDVTLGRGAYARPGLATMAAGACVLESLILAWVLVRQRRLTLRPLVADAVFGLVGLGLLSVATSQSPGRTGTIDWMLPYTVATAVGLGTLVGRAGAASGRESAGPRYDWRGAMVVAVVAGGYAASMSPPGWARGETLSQVLTNAGSYPVFYLAAAALSIGVRRRLDVVAERNEEAKREAAELAERATWRAAVVDVFGPVLDALDSAAEMGDEVPGSLRQEAGRLIGLIEATNPVGARGEAE